MTLPASINLGFQGGYVGSPTPPDQTGQGFPDGRNVAISFGGQAIEQLPGFYRTWLADLWDGTPANEIQIFEVPPSAFNATSGRGIVLVDGYNGRIVGEAHVAGGIPYSGSSATNLGTIRRHGPHDYPGVFSFKGKAIIYSAWDSPKVYDGQALRTMGAPSPRIKPILSYAKTSGDAGTVVSACNSAWTPVTATNGDSVTCGVSSSIKTEGTNSATITFTDDVQVDSTKFLAYSNTGDKSVDTGNKHVQFYLYNAHPTRIIPPNRLRFYLSSTATGAPSNVLTINSVTMSWAVPVALEPGVWTKVNLPMEVNGTGTIRQIGINLVTRLPDYLFDDSVTSFAVHVDDVRFFDSPTDAATLSAGKYQVAFAFYDPVRFVEGELSPFSESLVDIAGRSASNFAIDVSGYYPSIQAGLVNTSVVATNGPFYQKFTHVRIYITRPGFGTDEFGRPNFRLLMEKEIPTLGGNGEAEIVFKGEKTDFELTLSDFPILFPGYGGQPPRCRVMIPFADRLVAMGQPDYTVGEVGVTQYSHVVTPVTGASDPVDTPVFGPWMEGHTIRIGTDTRVYTIVKALDTDNDGVYESLWIGRGDTQAQRYEGVVNASFSIPYTGSTDTDTTYRIEGQKNIALFSHVGTQLGAQPEIWPTLNGVELEMENDQLSSAVTLGSMIAACGRRHIYALYPNPTSRDDFIDTIPFLRRPQLVESQRGVTAWRSFARINDTTALALGTNSEILIFTPNSVQSIPLSKNVRGFLNNSSEVARNLRQYAHAAYFPEQDWYALFLIKGSGSEPSSLTEYGSTQSQTALSTDFDRVIIVDLNKDEGVTATALIANDFNVTCTTVAAEEGATTTTYPYAVYCGDSVGFISQLFTPNAYGLGTPMTKVRGWAISATDTSTITVSANGGTNLPTTATALKDLYVTLFKADGSGFEKAAAAISSHTTDGTNVITLADTLANAFSTLTPEVGDTIGIGVQTHSIRFRELRFREQASIEKVEINLYNAGVEVSDPDLTVQTFVPSSGGRYLNNTTVKNDRRITESMIASGQGIVTVPGTAAHSQSVGLQWHSFGGAPFQIGPIYAYSGISPIDAKKGSTR